MDDTTNNNTLQPGCSGTRKRNVSITSDHQADIKRAKKAEYNKRYREKQALLDKDALKKKNVEYIKRYRAKQASLKENTTITEVDIMIRDEICNVSDNKTTILQPTN